MLLIIDLIGEDGKDEIGGSSECKLRGEGKF